ncbi:MAG TPA: tetratricopeptide repeat protein, partial [Azospirillaceae bacterium]|nr:tetratricopeptide repeat protein [Azospirillaceae bacterium]
ATAAADAAGAPAPAPGQVTGLPPAPAQPTAPPAAPPPPQAAPVQPVEQAPLTAASVGVFFMPGTLLPSTVSATPLPTPARPGAPVAQAAVQAAGVPPLPGAQEPEAPAPEPVTIPLDPGGPAAAAVFERGGWLYVLFDRAVPETTVPARDALPSLVGTVEVVRHPEGIGFRMAVPVVMEPRVEREGDLWRIRLERAGGEKRPGIAVDAEPDFALGPRLVAKAPDAEKIIDFQDPVVGDVLKVVPLSAGGQGIPVGLGYSAARFLPTAQGIVIQPIDERLQVQTVRDGVEVTVPGGLKLSPAEDLAAANPPPPVVETVRLFDYSRWGAAQPGGFIQGRQRRQAALLAQPVEERHRGRLDLARFYVANAMGHEALGMMNLILQDQPDLEKRGEFLAVRGAAKVLAGDHKGAVKDLGAPDVGSEPDTDLWRAAAAAGSGEWEVAHRLFQARRTLLRDYPDPFFTRFSLLAAEAALMRDDVDAAAAVLDRLAKRGGQTGPKSAWLAYLRGEQFRRQGAGAKALQQWRQAAEGFDRLARTRARWAIIEAQLADGAITPKQAADEMEKLRFAWRGDDLELAIQRRLGEVHAKAGNYAQAFDTMKRTVSLFPDSPQAAEVTRQMTGTFADLYKDGAAHLTPVEALSLYEQYRELTPAGPEGDAVIRRLAERLVEIDLLDRASDLLDRQVQYRLSGEEKARVGARLAGIRLLNNQPDLALAALDKSEVGTVPPDLAEERQLLRARALSRNGRSRDAIALLAPDKSRNANLLRIDIAFRDKQWAAAAQALADVIGAPPAAGQAIDPAVGKLVVNRAVALSLAQDGDALKKLKAEFGPAMEKGPDANIFRVLTLEESATGLVDAATIRARVAEIDLFRGFLDAYRAKRPETTPPQGQPAPAAPGAQQAQATPAPAN